MERNAFADVGLDEASRPPLQARFQFLETSIHYLRLFMPLVL